MAQFNINDTSSIYYQTKGNSKNPPIVLIHGFPMTHGMWEHQVDGLQKNFYVITYDLRDLGESETDDSFSFMESHVDDLFALLQHLKVEKTHVAGFSMGGYIALRAIERDPKAFQSLILVDTQSTADSNEGKIKRHQAAQKIRKDGLESYAHDFLKGTLSPKNFESNNELVGQLSKTITSNMTEGVLSAIAALISRTDTTESLSKIQVPTLILVGQEDKVTPLAAAEKMKSEIANSKLTVIPNAGHFTPVESPEATTKAILEFLS